MPSLTEGFEDINVRCNDNMYASQSHPMRNMDRGSSWIPTSQYEMPTTYTQSMQKVPQLSSQQATSHISPSLPPLRDISHSRDRMTSSYDTTYSTSNGQVSQVPRVPQYTGASSMYSPSQNSFGEMDFNSARTSWFSASHSYPPTTRSCGNYYDNTYGGYAAYPAYTAAYPTAVVSSQSGTGYLGSDGGLHSRKRRGNLPKPVTDILRAWFHDHLEHPYPSEEDKQLFIQRTGLTISQVSDVVPQRYE